MTSEPCFSDEQVIDMIKPFIGRTCTEQVVTEISALTRRPVRALGPRDAATMDMRPERINLGLDEQRVITAHIRFC
jgi:hypothetical protein